MKNQAKIKIKQNKTFYETEHKRKIEQNLVNCIVLIKIR